MPAAVEHTYDHAGTYHIVLEVSDGAGHRRRSRPRARRRSASRSTADAGDDQIATVGEVVELDGSNSGRSSASRTYSGASATGPPTTGAAVPRNFAAPGEQTVTLGHRERSTATDERDRHGPCRSQPGAARDRHRGRTPLGGADLR